jgi:hypothetical protein
MLDSLTYPKKNHNFVSVVDSGLEWLCQLDILFYFLLLKRDKF